MKIGVLIFCLVVVLGYTSFSESSPLSDARANKIADAIRTQENSTKYPYGIRSIPIKGNTQEEREAYARKICLNTVRNNYKRWQKAGEHGSYIDFLADRYCPPSADPKGNVNWKKNLRKLANEN